MKILENKTSYNVNDMIKIAQRENNKLRNYLLVNTMQAKHVPVSPLKCLDLFCSLGEQLYQQYKDETVVIIGFAETATAIGAAVTSCFKDGTFYLHTTREKIEGVSNIVDFQEEHSHATQQNLFCTDAETIIKKAERIIFVEDEITTGKTILNFVRALTKNGYLHSRHKISVGSIVNGMDEQHLLLFEKKGISYEYLVKIKYNHDETPFFKPAFSRQNQQTQKKTIENDVQIITAGGKSDPRIGVVFNDYEDACIKLADHLIERLSIKSSENKRILVLGTEECMYPAIFAGKKIMEAFPQNLVYVHATTRSPILPYAHEHYAIQNRNELISFYESERKTFIYNLEFYDKVIMITDSDEIPPQAFETLISVLNEFGCGDFLGIRWAK